MCHNSKSIDEFNLDVGKNDGRCARCRECDAINHKDSNPKSNPLRKFHYELAGGQAQYYALPDAERAQIRATVRARQSQGAVRGGGDGIPLTDTLRARDKLRAAVRDATQVRAKPQAVDPILRLAWKLAGGIIKYARLDFGLKAQLRLTARVLYDAGKTTASADEYEATHKEGFVYVMFNPAWPQAVKIGRAADPDARERSFQTSSPYRDYRMMFEMYFKDAYAAEKNIHEFLRDAQIGGEWFTLPVPDAMEIIKDYARSAGLL